MTQVVQQAAAAPATVVGNGETARGRSASTSYNKQLRVLEYDRHTHTMFKHEKRIGFYTFAHELGSGNFSQVVIATHDLTKSRVAMKILKKGSMDKKTRNLLSHEVVNMEKLHHPHIIQLFEVIHTSTKLYLSLELADRGELLTRINQDGRMKEDSAKIIFAQIVSAVQHMHQHRIVHRDLKAENIIFASRNHVKVGDFGFSCSSHKFDELMSTYCGSPPYAAPELFSNQSYRGKGVDVWALGVILYFVVTGVMPFRAETMGKLKRVIISGEYSTPSHVSRKCSKLISSILKVCCEERASVDDLLNSEWLSDVAIPQADTFYRKDPSRIKLESSETAEVLAVLSMDKIGISRRTINETALMRPWSSNQEMQDSRRRSQKLYCGVNERTAVIGCYRIFLHQHQQRLQHASYRERSTIEKMLQLKIQHQRSATAADGGAPPPNPTTTSQQGHQYRCPYCESSSSNGESRLRGDKESTTLQLKEKTNKTATTSVQKKSSKSRFCAIL